jgi:hypothetical protein
MKKVIILAEKHLEHQRSTLGLLVTTAKPLARSQSPALNIIVEKCDIPKFEMLASLQRQLCLRLASCALQS